MNVQSRSVTLTTKTNKPSRHPSLREPWKWLLFLSSLVGILFSTHTLAAGVPPICTENWTETHIDMSGGTGVIKMPPPSVYPQIITNWIPLGLQTVFSCRYQSQAYDATEYLLMPKEFDFTGGPVYETGIEGVGVQIQVRGSGAGGLSGFYNFPWQPSWSPSSGYSRDIDFRFEPRLRLVTTGSHVGAVTTPQIDLGRFWIHRHTIANDRHTTPFQFGIKGGTRLVYDNACTVLTPDTNVDFGNIKASDLPGVGSVAARRTFSIPFQCLAKGSVKLRFDGTTVASNEYALATTGTASGVGVRILYNAYVKKYGVGTEFNIIDAASTPTNNFESYFQADVIRTGPLTPGTFTATTTFTLLYP
ncbi:fimbrial protein [Shewanella gaetbuli]|uniref:Type 1 fimbrial protein n=1 Tax=Shewanella gaetbuli TaxID=220752 RepID=A0A9X2CHK2_9GAMM|nr:fimbrial protein [Shewanella gaetbuli]MCL1142112.1 type 1 fimbrial protein [Shewanella gaetbuli]